MSKHNKANKSNYIQAGRLTSDEMARETMRQSRESGRLKEEIRARENAGYPGAPESRNHRSEREESE